MPTEGGIQFCACSIPVPRQLTVYHDGHIVNSWPCTSREPFVLKRHFCTSLVLSLSQLPTFILLKSPKCLHNSHSCFLLQWENRSYPQKMVSSLSHHHNSNLVTQIPKWPALSNSHESCWLLYLFVTSTSLPHWRTTYQHLSPSPPSPCLQYPLSHPISTQICCYFFPLKHLLLHSVPSHWIPHFFVILRSKASQSYFQFSRHSLPQVHFNLSFTSSTPPKVYLSRSPTTLHGEQIFGA